MRKLILAIGLVVSLSVSAQEIKIKKGDLTIDGKLVAKVEDNGRDYTFKDLNGNTLFYATISKTDPTKKDDKGWVIFKGTNGNVREVAYKNGFTLSLGKLLAENAWAYGILNKDGGNQAGIAEFFAKEDKSFSEIRNNKKIAEKEDRAKENATGLTIDANNKISDANGKYIGYITRENIDGEKSRFGIDLISKFMEYRIYDPQNVLIAKLQAKNSAYKNNQFGLVIETIDKKEIPIEDENTFYDKPLAYDDLANRMIRKLYVRGYHFDEVVNNIKQGIALQQQAAQEAYNQEYKKVESNSLNIVDADGYITDKAGNKISGLISIPFENISEKMKPNSGISDITNFGGFVEVKNTEGKTKSYRAKDGYTVFAGDRTFIPAKGTNDDALGSDSGSQLAMLGQYQYFEKDYENVAGYIIHHVKTPKYFYIKLKNSDSASYLGEKGTFKKKSAEKMEKIFNETLKCSSMKFSDYDTNSKEGMIKILDDYAAKCK